MDTMSSRLLKSIPMVGLGIVTFFLLFAKSEEPMAAFGKDCLQRAQYPYRCGIQAIDELLCTLVQFFKQGLASEDGRWVSGYTVSLLLSVSAFMAVEGSRFKSGWFLSLLPLHLLLVQLAGVSVIVPLVWIPAYFLYAGGNREPSHIWKKKVSLLRVGAIAFFLMLLQLNSIGLFFPFESSGHEIACLLFQVLPPILSLCWLAFPTTEKTSQQQGHKGVVALHLLHAGAGIVWHLIAILYVIRDPELPARVFTLLRSWASNEFTTYFLLVDGLVLFLAFLYLASVEDGIQIGMFVLIASVVFGPAFAVSAYCVYREQQINAATALASNRKSE